MRLAGTPPIFILKKIERTLTCMNPAWLDDIIVVTCGKKQEHVSKLKTVLKKLKEND